ncbi:ribonuclease H protein [Canna indica]|uniref:Ribonuclease H protein n=1 Tax=Canna indica TaxID=4628 RepID=A0AAQ3JYF6_9LILI|nr:ribonuclease H protein [Canna indica]
MREQSEVILTPIPRQKKPPDLVAGVDRGGLNSEGGRFGKEEEPKGSISIPDLDAGDKEVLPQLAAIIGRPLKIDNYSMAGTRGRFGRVCVLMDIRKPIQQDFWIENSEGAFFQSVAYENLLKICFKCGKVGHLEIRCSLNGIEKGTDSENKVSSDNMISSDKECEKDKLEGLLGPWVQVQRKRKRFVKAKNSAEHKNKNSFVILNNQAFEEDTRDAGKYEDLSEVVKQAWCSDGIVSKSLEEKQEILAKELSSWNRMRIGNLERNLNEAMDRLKEMEKIEEREKNSKYYHNLVKLKRYRSGIDKLVVDSKVLTDSKEMVDEFANWYENLWKLERVQYMYGALDKFQWRKIDPDDVESLTAEFGLEEIWYAMNGLGRGQNINKKKSEIYFPKHCKAEFKHRVSQLFEMKEGRYPMKYLGTFISPRKLDREHQSILIQKVKKKINNWAAGQMSQVGKCTLLSSMERKSAKLLSWKYVTNKRSAGGLGIRNLHVLKKVILAKRLLPILNNESSNWVRLMKAKYGVAHPWKNKYGFDGSWSMKSIANCMLALRGGLRKTLGNGKQTNVWDDLWLDQVPLSVWPTFLDVKELSKYNLVSDLIENES